MRIENIRKQLEKMNLDGLLVTNKINRRYLTGFTGSSGVLAVTKDEVCLIVDGRYTEQAKKQAPEIKVIVPPVGTNVFDFWHPIRGTKWGIEQATLSYSEYLLIKERAEIYQIDLVETINLIEKARIVKSREEQQCIKEAARISDATLMKILPMIQVGISELELANEIDYYSKQIGSQGAAFETIVASGKRTALPHAHASKNKISDNSLLMIDFGSIVDGYYSDVTRTFAIGKVSREVKQSYQHLLAAQKQAVASAKKGTTLRMVDSIVRKSLAEHGLDAYFTHNTGHGIGLSCHEFPAVGPNTDVLVQEKMVFTVEPGIYIKDQYGIRIEDDILIDENGEPRVLTKFTKEWTEIACTQKIY
ncbi:MAG: M24 family metallopeptidase [Enterococcus sp.]